MNQQVLKLREMLIESVRHRGLGRLIEDGNPQSIDPGLLPRVLNVLTALSRAENIADFTEIAPRGWHVHRLAGNRRNQWSVSVSGNWRLTFEESGNRIFRLNLEDYH